MKQWKNLETIEAMYSFLKSKIKKQHFLSLQYKLTFLILLFFWCDLRWKFSMQEKIWKRKPGLQRSLNSLLNGWGFHKSHNYQCAHWLILYYKNVSVIWLFLKGVRNFSENGGMNLVWNYTNKNSTFLFFDWALSISRPQGLEIAFVSFCHTCQTFILQFKVHSQKLKWTDLL